MDDGKTRGLARGVARVPRSGPPLLEGPSQSLRIARLKTRKRRRSPLWAKVSVVVGVMLMLVSGLAAAAGTLFFDHLSHTIQQEHLLGPVGAGGGQGASITGPVNILFVGLDTRDANPGMGSRADSIIIAHIPAAHDEAYLVSIPRDTNAVIPPFPRTRYPGGTGKINAAFQFGSANGGGEPGGTQLLALAIRQLTGITFNAAVIVNFDGFKDVVAALGGVRMCIDERVTSLHTGFFNGTTTRTAPYRIYDGGLRWSPIPGTHPMVYEPGCRHLSAWEALDYVRQRDMLARGDGDYGRQRHQQQFIKALFQEGMQRGLANPLTLNTFLTKVSEAFVFDGNGTSIPDWVFAMKAITPSALVMIKTNAGTYNTIHVGSQSREELSPESLELFSDVRNDTVGAFVAEHPSWVNS